MYFIQPNIRRVNPIIKKRLIILDVYVLFYVFFTLITFFELCTIPHRRELYFLFFKKISRKLNKSIGFCVVVAVIVMMIIVAMVKGRHVADNLDDLTDLSGGRETENDGIFREERRARGGHKVLFRHNDRRESRCHDYGRGFCRAGRRRCRRHGCFRSCGRSRCRCHGYFRSSGSGSSSTATRFHFGRLDLLLDFERLSTESSRGLSSRPVP